MSSSTERPLSQVRTFWCMSSVQHIYLLFDPREPVPERLPSCPCCAGRCVERAKDAPVGTSICTSNHVLAYRLNAAGDGWETSEVRTGYRSGYIVVRGEPSPTV
jgi:hypothetical protein